MKKLLLFIAIAFMGIKALAQAPIITYNFNNTLNNSSGLNPFSNSGITKYVRGRDKEYNGAIKMFNTVLTATIPNIPVGTSARTVSIWVNFNTATLPANSYLFAYGTANPNQAFGLTQSNISSNSQINLYGWANDLVVNPNPLTQTGVWINFVATFDGTVAKIYQDGILLTTGSKTWNTVGNVLKIGATVAANSLFILNADVDDLEIFDIALTDAQVQTRYNTTKYIPNINSKLLAYYAFDSNLSSHNGLYNLSNDDNVTNIISGAAKYGANGTYFNAASTSGNALKTTALNNTIKNDEFTICFWEYSNAYQQGGAPAKIYPTSFDAFGSAFFRRTKTTWTETTPPITFGYAVPPSAFGTLNNSSFLANDVWRHIAITFYRSQNTQYFSLYVNGTFISTISGTPDTQLMQKLNNVFSIGSGTNADGTWNNSKTFSGNIDEFYIYDRGLDATQIIEVMNNSAGVLSNENFNSQNLKATIFPNPATDVLNIQIENELKSVEIYSLLGQKIMTSDSKQINVSNLAKGIYSIRIEDENGATATQKLVKK
jgi:Secretion system C-terminal sorting domain/Concanavalin A-like lectin/glucanases superfamily